MYVWIALNHPSLTLDQAIPAHSRTRVTVEDEDEEADDEEEEGEDRRGGRGGEGPSPGPSSTPNDTHLTNTFGVMLLNHVQQSHDQMSKKMSDFMTQQTEAQERLR